jgi:hypothetical protein
VILSTSASHVARITGMSPPVPGPCAFYVIGYLPLLLMPYLPDGEVLVLIHSF